jgi:pyruvate formate lyase activating enzyme
LVEIKGLEKFAPKDFPGFIAATVFLGRCNFRCPFCHNVDLVLRPDSLPTFPMDYFLAFLDARKDWLEGVCITGGEPLVHEDLDVLLTIIKERNLLLKVDTNGSLPRRLDSLIKKGLLDHIAMDVKTSFDKYPEAVGGAVDVKNISESIAIIRNSGVDYTFRTTAVPGLVDREDIEKISAALQGSKMFHIQQYVPDHTLESDYENIKPYPAEELRDWVEIARPHFMEVLLEGV